MCALCVGKQVHEGFPEGTLRPLHGSPRPSERALGCQAAYRLSKNPMKPPPHRTTGSPHSMVSKVAGTGFVFDRDVCGESHLTLLKNHFVNCGALLQDPPTPGCLLAAPPRPACWLSHAQQKCTPPCRCAMQVAERLHPPLPPPGPGTKPLHLLPPAPCPLCRGMGDSILLPPS